MEANWGYPGEITSAYVNQGCDHDISKHSKKRKFLSEVNEQLRSPASKYICCETLVERGPFSKESQQAKVFYPHLRKEKMSLEEVEEDIGADSTQGSCITVEDSFSRFSHIKSYGYDKSNSYGGSSLSYSSSETAVPTSLGRDFITSSHQDIEFDDGGNGEDELDEFGHCLGYLVSACDNDSKEQMDEEFEDFFCINGMAPKSGQVSQLRTHEPTIDQEFEEYFSTLML